MLRDMTMHDRDFPDRAYIKPGAIVCCDWLELMQGLAPQSVDMILTDMPYGVTACKWDTVIDLEAWWVEVRRVIKPRGAIVMTASQPFTTRLISSNYEWFREEIVWLKSNGGMFLNANRQHLKRHENVIVFSNGLNTYNPQMTTGEPYRIKSGVPGIAATKDKNTGGHETINGGLRYPISYLRTKSRPGQHPTQKPVALFEYLIKTYTQPGELVVDPFVGSGTTAVAAQNTERRFIVGDQDAEYCEVARRRVYPELGKVPKRPGKVMIDIMELPLLAYGGAENG